MCGCCPLLRVFLGCGGNVHSFWRSRGRWAMSTMIRPMIQVNARSRPCSGSSIEDEARRAHVAAQRRRGVLLIAVSCLIALALSLALFKSASAAILGAPTGSGSSSQSHSSTGGLGYWLVASDGGIFSEGGAPFRG